MTKPKYRPYISLDLESTGLDVEKVDIIELGAVLDDGISPIDKLRKISMVIDLKKFNNAEVYALNMNKDILQEIVDGKGKDTEDVFLEFAHMLECAVDLCVKYDLEHTNKYDYLFTSKNDGDPAEIVKKKTKVEIAGKNAAGFDIPLFKNFFKRNYPDTKFFYSILKLIHYKTLDPGPMYFPDFGYNPSLAEINKITGRGVIEQGDGRMDVSHRALDDALDVVYAIRHKMGML